MNYNKKLGREIDHGLYLPFGSFGISESSRMIQASPLNIRENLSPVWDRVADPDTGDVFSILRSETTGVYVTFPVPSDIAKYYTDSYHGNRHGFTTPYCDWRRIRIIQRVAGPRQQRWLDVGCGDGTLLQAIGKLGWMVRGVEMFPASARSKGLTVFESLAEAAADGPYDGISLWHVLEHLADPCQELENIRALLKPEGVLLISVPDASSFSAKWFGPSWLHWDVPKHLYHFSADSLHRLLGQHGYVSEQLPVSEFEYDLMGFAQSAMNKIGMEPNAFYKLTTKRKLKLKAWSRAANFTLGCLLCFFGALPVWLIGRRGRGGTLIFEARIRP